MYQLIQTRKTNLFKLLLLFTVVVQSQTVTTVTVIKRYGLDKVEAKYFEPITVHFKKDSVVDGYGYFKVDIDHWYLAFSETKPLNESDLYNRNKSLFHRLRLGEFKKIEIGTLTKKEVLYSVKARPYLSAVLQKKKYENDTFILYASREEKVHKGRFIGYIFLQKGKEKGQRILFDLKKSHKPIKKRFFKNFNDCKTLYEKIKQGEFKNTVEDLIKILDFYDNKCENSK